MERTMNRCREFGLTALIGHGLDFVQFRAALSCVSCAIAMVALGSSTSFAAGDATAGQHVFATRCGICHATEPGVKKIGPSLAGVVGRKSGTESGFDYSAALKTAAITWNDKTLDQFIQNSATDVPGT